LVCMNQLLFAVMNIICCTLVLKLISRREEVEVYERLIVGCW
jgi:hypothetical protein